MRSSLLIAGLLPLAQAYPQIFPRGASANGSAPGDFANSTNMTTGPLGGTLITDPVRLQFFEALHSEMLQSFNNGSAVPLMISGSSVGRRDALGNEKANPLAERQDPLTIAGFWLFVALGAAAETFEEVLEKIADLFLGPTTEWWKQTSRCRTHFKTHAGAEEEIDIFAKGSEGATTKSAVNVAWNDPEHTDPPILYFDDPDIGPYSVQFTATDTVAWQRINTTVKCHEQGLCNPQYTFYHKLYTLALNTWESQGDVSSCQYSGGKDCKGVCHSGVLDQFTKNGVVWGGDCAIPCYDDLPQGTPLQPKQSPKILVVGDSISHGMQDDWTWRYRLWKWLDHMGYESTFVGPYQGTHGIPGIESTEPTAPLLDGEEPLLFVVDGGYAAGVPDNFTSSGHAAYWGRQALQDAPLVKAWVKQYQPDYLLTLLGFNDLGWWVSGPDGLLGQMGSIVENAREAKADIKILVGNVVQRLFISGRQDLVDNTNTYNELLRSTLPNWFRWESPIAYVDVAANYECGPASCPDGYDGLHPDVLGEHHIAQAFSNVLHDNFDFPGVPYKVPDPIDDRPVSTPTNVRSYSYPEGIFTTWDTMPNNRRYEIRSRLQGMTDWWSDGDTSVPGNWLSWIQEGQVWESQVRTITDFNDHSDWSPIVTATAHPQTAPGPSNIGVGLDGDDGITVSWSAVVGYDVNRYGLILWDRDTPGSYISMYATTGTSITVHGLTPFHLHDVWVATYVNMAHGSLTQWAVTPGGLPAAARSVIIGAGVPAPPASLSVGVIDATSIDLSWPAAANVAGYTIYMKSLTTAGAGFQSIGETTDTSMAIYLLFPGIWTYQFCIGSYNGDLQSAYGNACVIPPRCCGYKRDEQILNVSSSDVGFSNNATGTGPVAVPLPVTNVTAITTDPEVGRLYQLYTEAMAALKVNNTALINAPPDTVVKLF